MKILKGETYKERLLIAYLQEPESIRISCHTIWPYAQQGMLKYFICNLDHLPTVADFVIKNMRANYPDLNIPYHGRWRHFAAGGVNRIELLKQKFTNDSWIKSSIELTILSVLLDAGAGVDWHYKDYVSNTTLNKSEGLAAASFNLFMRGIFSTDSQNIYQADALGLQKISLEIMHDVLEVAEHNQLLGLAGRTKLLQLLGITVANKTEYFANGRLGDIADFWLDKVVSSQLSMRLIFSSLLDAFNDIWPGKYVIDGVNLGDVWPYSLLVRDVNPRGFIPFHKLTQWLCYSLIEPLEELGITVTDLDLLTGLPEYRNGGLFVDLGVLTPRDPNAYVTAHALDSEFIIEWRAMTVLLIDKLAEIIRTKLNLTAAQLPLAKILQGGTWSAGREIAAQLRVDGGAPFKLISDGTIF